MPLWFLSKIILIEEESKGDGVGASVDAWC